MYCYLLLRTRVGSTNPIFRLASARLLFTKKELIVPPPALHQVSPPPGEVGHFKYERYWSNNPRYVPQVPGDTLGRCLFRKLREKYELWPFLAYLGVYVIFTTCIIYFTVSKVDVGFVAWRTWPKIRDKYWKMHTTIYDPTGDTHQRFPLMEELLDEIEAASQKRLKEDEERDAAIKRMKESMGHKKHH